MAFRSFPFWGPGVHRTNALPRGEGGPKGRERNSGDNPKVCTALQTSGKVALKTAPRWKSSNFRNRKVTARIPHQSWHRLWRHHDSFPPGEAFWKRRRRQFGMCEEEGPGSIFRVIARAKPVVTEGNACGAIRSPSGPFGTGRYKASQGMRIATSGFALLAMTEVIRTCSF